MLDLDGLAGRKVVVVGIGNTLRGDDGAGSLVAGRLRERYQHVVFDAAQAPENYLAPIRRANPDVVVLVDAADFGGSPGEVRAATAEDVEGLMMGTHAAPLSMFMKVLGQETRADVKLVAIQAATTALGAGLTREVADAVENLVSQLQKLLDGRSET
ncbi:MAG: hydrogenase 3 maturation endopeptidase HyCI [Candidatus Eisenbacteria bacterium]|nr:hydrogenase 3 maturation endopeptidase HyCI [Candidatus Eisenbacteria bacterium]